MIDIDNLNYIGVWSNATTYALNDVVQIANDGYYASVIASNLNNDPRAENFAWKFIHDIEPDQPINDTFSAYSAIVTYRWGTAVTSGNKSYISRVYNNLGNLVTDTDFWRELSEFENAPACGSEYVGDWKSGQEYFFGQVVTFEGNYYTAIIQNTNRVPGTVLDNIWKICGSTAILPNVATDLIYDSAITYQPGENVVSLSGYRALVSRVTQGAAITDTRYFIPASNSTSLDVNSLANVFTGTSLRGHLYTYQDGLWLAIDDTTTTPKLGSNVWKLIGSSGTSPEADDIPINGESIAVILPGVFIGTRTLASSFYMKYRNFIYHWKNNDQWRIHNKGRVQTVDGRAVDFELVFYISYKGLRKVIDFLHIITNAATRFKTIKYLTNFTEEQIVNDTDTDRYKIKEGEHRVAAKEVNTTNRVRGNWVKVSITRTSAQSSVSFNITTVKSKARISH